MIFDSPIDDLDLDDIQRLIDREVEEGNEVEYKATIDLSSFPNKHKQKLVGEVVSFANDKGGYFIVGVEEDAGVPQNAAGFSVDDPDAVKEQWGNIIRADTEPQIPPGVFVLGSIRVEDGEYIFDVEVE